MYGLYMNRRNNFPTYLSYDSAAAFPPALTTNSTGNHFGGGVETWIGRYLNDCWSVAAGYWGFYPSNQTATALNSYYSGDLSSAILYTGLSYNNGTGPQTLSNYYGTPGNPAEMHQLTRSFQAHNFEVNFIRNPYRNTGGAVHFELLAGVRYLKLDDGMMFSSDLNNTTLGDDPNNELHHIIDVKNHLVGFQIGGRADRYFGSRFGVHLGSKLGIYNNHITHFQRICGGNGNAYITGTTDNYYIDNSADNLAFVGELFAGTSYNFCNWKLTGGYRAVSACGVALATSQFPREREFVSVSRSGQVNAGDCLLLHGAYFGAEYNW